MKNISDIALEEMRKKAVRAFRETGGFCISEKERAKKIKLIDKIVKEQRKRAKHKRDCTVMCWE